MITLDDLKTRAGELLYRQLPEEYRFQDTAPAGELGDLEAYLHGIGHLLDLIRGTAEQVYADAFAEAIDLPGDAEGNPRVIQTWLLPYLAELVGAELLAPDPERRLKELNNAVSWYKTKGTPRNIDHIADVISASEAVLVEGWRRVLMTPRLDLPPFTAPAEVRGDGNPLGPPAWPLGTPDLRSSNRAVVDPNGANPLYRLTLPLRDADGLPMEPEVSFWRPYAREGVPCFAGAFDDTSLRTPDVRDPDSPEVGPHPRRSLIHIRPPFGFFEPGLKTLKLSDSPGPGDNPLGFDLANKTLVQTFSPATVLKAFGIEVEDAKKVPDKLVIAGELAIPGDLQIRFENLLFTGTIKVEAHDNAHTRLFLTRCAIATVELAPWHDLPVLEANDSLFGEIVGPDSFVQLVHCTVLGDTTLARLWASDCLFANDVIGIDCSAVTSCVRYSALPDLTALSGCKLERNPNNVASDPNFIRLYFDDGDHCVLRPAVFGEPGCGVLDRTTSLAILEGAEDNGEMGAYHHRYHHAQLQALQLKLRDYLPHGQEISSRYDPRLARKAAVET